MQVHASPKPIYNCFVTNGFASEIPCCDAPCLPLLHVGAVVRTCLEVNTGRVQDRC